MKRKNEASTITASRKEEKTIYLLPQFPCSNLLDDSDLLDDIEKFAKVFKERRKKARTLDYTPDSIQTLLAIDYEDTRDMMLENMNFYNAVISLCSDIIEEMIAFTKRMTRSKRVQKAASLDDILNSGYYGQTYQEARREFIGLFLSDFLYDKYLEA